MRSTPRGDALDRGAVVLGVDSVPDFNALHSRKHDEEVDRKTNLAWLLARRPDWILWRPSRLARSGPDLFRKGCEFGLEGLVSKPSDPPDRSGRSKDWIKMKNRHDQQ